jgi:hypothetical protein
MWRLLVLPLFYLPPMPTEEVPVREWDQDCSSPNTRPIPRSAWSVADKTEGTVGLPGMSPWSSFLEKFCPQVLPDTKAIPKEAYTQRFCHCKMKVR